MTGQLSSGWHSVVMYTVCICCEIQRPDVCFISKNTIAKRKDLRVVLILSWLQLWLFLVCLASLSVSPLPRAVCVCVFGSEFVGGMAPTPLTWQHGVPAVHPLIIRRYTNTGLSPTLSPDCSASHPGSFPCRSEHHPSELFLSFASHAYY